VTSPPGVDPIYPNIGGVGGYVRWRNRHVRSSILQDLKETLSFAGWLGTTPTVGLVTTKITFTDAFPEEALSKGQQVDRNTFVLDNGRPGPLEEYELGGLYSREYAFNMAFFAENDAVALSLFGDLEDRYNGLSVEPWISLFNYSSSTPTLITRMEVENFEFGRAPREIAANERFLFFAELRITDYIEQIATRSQ
jgi:hypothetical protein